MQSTAPYRYRFAPHTMLLYRVSMLRMTTPSPGLLLLSKHGPTKNRAALVVEITLFVRDLLHHDS